MPNPYSKKFFCSSSIMILLGCATLSIAPAQAQTVACQPPVIVNSAPPPLPEYQQPPLPGPGYVWTPGYWSWDSDEEDYYWVPGTWVEPPRAGLLWTPGYWSWASGSYLFHEGYWGSRVGYYGGIHYGHGYDGEGYEGGRWRNGHFFYNRSVTNITTTNVTNVYEQPVHVNRSMNRVSFNGGTNGTRARPTSEQRVFSRQQHFAPTTIQQKNVSFASKDKALSNKTNHGRPPVAATAHPAQFNGTGVVPSHRPGEAAPAANGAQPGLAKPGMTKPEGMQPGTMKPEGRGHGMAAPEGHGHEMAAPETGRHGMTPPAGNAETKPQSKPATAPNHPGVNGMMREHSAPGESKPTGSSHASPQTRPGHVGPATRQERPAQQPGHAEPNRAQPRPQGGWSAPQHSHQAPMQMQRHTQPPTQMQRHNQAPMQMQQHHQPPMQMQRHEPNHPAAAPHNGGEHGRPAPHGPANAHPHQGGNHHGQEKQDEKR